MDARSGAKNGVIPRSSDAPKQTRRIFVTLRGAFSPFGKSGTRCWREVLATSLSPTLRARTAAAFAPHLPKSRASKAEPPHSSKKCYPAQANPPHLNRCAGGVSSMHESSVGKLRKHSALGASHHLIKHQQNFFYREKRLRIGAPSRKASAVRAANRRR
jgi:hypothetical protein